MDFGRTVMQTRSDVTEVSTQTECDESAPDIPLYRYQAEVDLRRKVEGRRDEWKAEARRLEKLLRKANAALDNSADKIKYMVKGDPHFYEEAQVWRQRMRRWDPRNWADLSVSGLAGKRGSDEINYTHDITDSLAFGPELKAIHARRDEQCRDYLATHAFRPAKLALIKYSHRVSGRRCAWINSMLKFDHSARDAKGERSSGPSRATPRGRRSPA